MATTAAKATAEAAAPPAGKDKPADKKGAASEAAPPGKKSRLSKKMLIILLAANILLAGVGGGLWFFLGRHPAEEGPAAGEADKAADVKGEAAKAPAKKAEAKKEDKKKKPVEYMSGDPFYTVNLADEETDRYLQLGLVFEVSDPKAAEELKEKMPVVRSNVLYLLSSKKSHDLQMIEGKRQLAGEILAIARQALDLSPPENGIDAVDFSVFVIQ